MYHPARAHLYANCQPSSVFAAVQSAAHEAATGHNSRPEPTPAQAIAGNYKKGRINLHGLWINIENVRNSVREGESEGKQWSNRMAAHYGEFVGTVGADGDPIDVYIGLFPESNRVWVINQRYTREPIGFDEHKVMLGFASEQQAVDAYQLSFDRDWKGLASIYECSVPLLKHWLSHGDHSQPFTPNQVSFEGKHVMDKVLWDSEAQPVTTQLHKLLYDLRVHDKDEGLMLDAVTMAELMLHPDIDETPMFDALVVQVARMQMKMDLLMRVMASANQNVKPVAVTISDPVRARGVMQVMVLFEMSDGQTITIWFHNPDTTPAKLTPMDELISWKWMLNKKDVTIVVAPERGKDLNVREVARRMMRLIERNSEAFKKANAKLAERIQQTEEIKIEIVALESQLTSLNRQIEVATQVIADTPVAPKVIVPEPEEKLAGDGGEDAALSEAGVAADDIAAMNDDGGYKAIMGSEKLSLKWQDVLDAAFNQRIVAVRNALRELGWNGAADEEVLHKKTDAKITYYVQHHVTQIGAGNNVIGVAWGLTGEKIATVIDALREPAAALAVRIDGEVPVAEVSKDPARIWISGEGLRNLCESRSIVVDRVDSEEDVQEATLSLNGKRALLEASDVKGQEWSLTGVDGSGFTAASATLSKALDQFVSASSEPVVVPATAEDVSKLFAAGSIAAAYAAWQADLAGEEKLDLTEFTDMWWNENGQAELWMLPAKVVKGWSQDEYQAAYDALENWNYHPEALTLTAKRLGNAGDVKEAISILKNQRSEGSATMSMLDRRAVLGAKLRHIGKPKTLANEVEAKADAMGMFAEIFNATDGAIGITLARGAVKATLEQRNGGASWNVIINGEDNPRSSSSSDYIGCLEWFLENAYTPRAAAPAEDELVAAGFIAIPNSNVYAKTIEVGEGETLKKYLFNVKFYGDPVQFKVTLSVSFGARFTGAPSQEVGVYNSKADVIEAINNKMAAFVTDAEVPETVYGPDVVSVYATKGGKEAMVIKSSESGSYSWIGAYGAGSGHSGETMLAAVDSNMLHHPGMKLIYGKKFAEVVAPAAGGNNMNAGYASQDEWKGAVTDVLAATAEVSNGDAQGMVEAQEVVMTNAWAAGKDAVETAALVMAAGVESIRESAKLTPAASPYEMGVAGYAAGLKASAQDAGFIEAYIKGKKVGESLKELDDWTRGWTAAHIKATDAELATIAANAPGAVDPMLKPLTPQSPERIKWEDELTNLVSEAFEMSRGDAQGTLEVKPDEVDAQFAAGASPQAALLALWPETATKDDNGASAADREYLQSLVDGSADMFAADVFDKLEPMFEKYAANADMTALLNQAAEAYSAAAVAAAQKSLAGG